VLERLTQFSAREVERNAVLIVRGERLQEWRAAGFPQRQGGAGRIDLTFDQAGLAGEAVRTGRAVIHVGVAPERLPAFASGAGTRAAAALPVTVGGAVVAILYADAPSPDPVREGRWPATLEVLARHASRVLEAMTIQHAAGLRPTTPSAPSSTAGALRGSMQ